MPPNARTQLPEEVVTFAVRLHVRHGLSLRQVQDLLRRRGAETSHEAIRGWAAVRLRRLQALPVDLSVRWATKTRPVVVRGELVYLSWAESPHGDLLDLLMQPTINETQARRQLARGIAEQARLTRICVGGRDAPAR